MLVCVFFFCLFVSTTRGWYHFITLFARQMPDIEVPGFFRVVVQVNFQIDRNVLWSKCLVVGFMFSDVL